MKLEGATFQRGKSLYGGHLRWRKLSGSVLQLPPVNAVIFTEEYCYNYLVYSYVYYLKDLTRNLANNWKLYYENNYFHCWTFFFLKKTLFLKAFFIQLYKQNKKYNWAEERRHAQISLVLPVEVIKTKEEEVSSLQQMV